MIYLPTMILGYEVAFLYCIENSTKNYYEVTVVYPLCPVGIFVTGGKKCDQWT